jgi:pimeloyl-ACP methyl ester carboxylesterase
MQRIAVRGLTFDVRVDGPPDGEAVLLLHGFPQGGGVWGPVAARLNAAGLRTVAPDLRGYSPGARPENVEAYRITECTADADALLGALDIDSAHVVGHDWGAVAAWHLAGRYPERVRTLTAVSVPHPVAAVQAVALDPEQQQLSSYIGLFRQQGRAEQVLLGDGANGLRGMLAASGLTGPRLEEYVAAATAPGILTAGLNWYRALNLTDLDGLGPVTCPTTYVWGDQDTFFGRFGVERCRENVAGPYQFVELAGMSHWIPELAPELLAGLILERATPRPR